MSFADNYFKRYNSLSKIFSDNPCSNTGIIVVIPCYDDDFVFKTLKSIEDAHKPNCSIEIIVIVNSGENTCAEIVERNRSIYNQMMLMLEDNLFKTFTLLPHLIEGTVKKTAGVGFARKTGMDEAVRRFDQLNKAEGIICSLDADALISKDYFTKISEYYSVNMQSKACIFQFRHNFDIEIFDKEEIEACQLYEIYLRYFRLALEFSGFPYPIHTIGSCFSVKAETYCKVGGMSTRQGGEDFYFLHKLAPMCKIGKINQAIVFPAPRISDRVPFGTGPAVRKIINDANYHVYNFELFLILKQFYFSFENLYFSNSNNFIDQIIPEDIINNIGSEKLKAEIAQCLQNTNSQKAFIKRMFSIFDAFFAIRFLNSFDEQSKYPPEDILICANKFLKKSNISISNVNSTTVYEAILEVDGTTL